MDFPSTSTFTFCCQKVSFPVPAFYFLKLELSSTKNLPTRYRTEVSKETASPEYQTAAFRFPIPSSTDVPVKISVVACKIARNAETGTRVDVVGTATLDVKPMLEGWRQNRNEQNVFSTSLRLAQTKPSNDVSKPELMHVGHLDVTITFPLSTAPNKSIPANILAPEVKGNQQNLIREGSKLPDMPSQFSSLLYKQERASPRIPDLTYPNRTYQFLIHAVHLLPNNSTSTKSDPLKEEIPAIFVCIKTLYQAQQKEPAKAATRVANVSRDSYFGETLYLNIPEQDSSSLPDPTIVISVADEKSSTYISTYILPLSAKQFMPFRQVTLMLGPPETSANPSLHNKPQQQAILLISITSYDTSQSVPYMPTSLLKSASPDDIIHNVYPQTNNIFMEIVVRHLREISSLPMKPSAPFIGIPRSLIVIARVVKNADEYIGRVETWRKQLQAGLPVEPPHALQNIPYCSFDSSGELLNYKNVPANDNNWVYISNAAAFDDHTSSTNTIDGENGSKNEETGVKLIWNEYFVCPVEKSDLSDQNALVIEFHSAPLHPTPLSSPPEHPSSSSFTGMFWGYGLVNLTDPRLSKPEVENKLVPLKDVSVHVIAPDVIEQVMDANNVAKEKGRTRVVCALDVRVPRRWAAMTMTIPAAPAAVATKSELKSHNDNGKNGGDIPNPVEAENIQTIRKEMASENVTFQETQQRQKLVDRLLSELDTRTEAVKTLSQEIVFLRETNTEMKSQNQELRRQLQEKSLKSKQLVNQADIDVLSHDELKRRFAFILEKFSAESARCKDLSSRLETLQDVVIERNELQKKTLELRHAHTAQQAYVQKLQERVNETAKYRSTIKKQEQVIRKMEEFVQVTLAGPQKASFEAFLAQKGDPRVSKQKSNENVGSGDNLEREVQEPTQTKGGKVEEDEGRKVSSDRKGRKAEKESEQKFGSSTPIATDRSADINETKDSRGEVEIMDDADVLKLLVRAESAEARVVALEQELVESVKNFGRQIGDLKLELQESYLQGRGRTIPDTTPWYSLQDENPTSKTSRSRSPSSGKSSRTKPSGYLQPLARDIP